MVWWLQLRTLQLTLASIRECWAARQVVWWGSNIISIDAGGNICQQDDQPAASRCWSPSVPTTNRYQDRKKISNSTSKIFNMTLIWGFITIPLYVTWIRTGISTRLNRSRTPKKNVLYYRNKNVCMTVNHRFILPFLLFTKTGLFYLWINNNNNKFHLESISKIANEPV